MEHLFGYLLALGWFLIIMLWYHFLSKKDHFISTTNLPNPSYEKYLNATNGIVNHNRTLTKFVYKVYMSKEEIISSLKIMNVKDSLSCAFDFEKNIIIFSELGGFKNEFFYEIQECDGFSILKLRQTSLLGTPHYDYKLNLFMISKINAEVIPFSQYGN